MATHPVPVLRFAPSPNGRLHLGHAYSALLNADLARRLGGRFIVRIEDIDTVRCTPELTRACLDDLAWLGLDWERPERRQSAHFADYGAALAKLDGLGLIYPCFCSRREIEAAAGPQGPRQPDGGLIYPGTCRDLPAEEGRARMASGAPYALRLHMTRALRLAPPPFAYRRFAFDGGEEEVAADPAAWGDIVLARKETPTSYHLSVVVDDALQGVTHVVRGADLEAATDIHVLLQRLLGLPSPLYHHHALIADAGGDKLAKSRGSRSLADLRAAGIGAADIRRQLGFS